MSATSENFAAAREILDTMVMHVEFERALIGADEATRLVAELGNPSGVLVTADPGMGKTLWLELVKVRARKHFVNMTNEDPVLHVAFDALVDLPKVASLFMKALGFPMLSQRTSLDSMTNMVDTAMDRLKPRVVLIDEAQHVCEGARDITARAVTDWLKRRMDLHCLMMVLTGTKTLSRLRDINPQFSSRVSGDYLINTFAYGEAWHQLLGGVADGVKKADLGTLRDKRVSKRLHTGTGGNLRSLKKWLARASLCASQDGRRAVLAADFEQGFDAEFGANTSIPNPFKEL